MPQYEFSAEKFIPELGVTLYPTENPHELPEELANRLMENDPHLLRPLRQTTQAKPKAARGRPKKA